MKSDQEMSKSYHKLYPPPLFFSRPGAKSKYEYLLHHFTSSLFFLSVGWERIIRMD